MGEQGSACVMDLDMLKSHVIYCIPDFQAVFLKSRLVVGPVYEDNDERGIGSWITWVKIRREEGDHEPLDLFNILIIRKIP